MNADDWQQQWDERCLSHPAWEPFWRKWQAMPRFERPYQSTDPQISEKTKALMAFGTMLSQEEAKRARAAHMRSLQPKAQRRAAKDVNSRVIQDLRKEVAALHTRVDDLRENQISYAGVYRSEEWYRRGEITTHSGTLWIAETATQAKPGTANSGWRMMHKNMTKTRTRKETT